MDKVTVIMRTKNSGEFMPAVLKALFSQEGVDFELAVIDSSSTDKTVECLKLYPHHFTQIPAEEYVPGPVLNRMVEKAETPIVVFLNSDAHLLSPNSLSELLRPFDDPDVEATFGRQRPRPDALAWVEHALEVSFPAHGPAPDWVPFALPFAAMRKSAWERHPFYSKAWGSEDTEWGVWANRIEYVPRATVMHSQNYTQKQLYGRMFIEGEADAFIYGKYASGPAQALLCLKEMVREVWLGVKKGEWRGLLQVPARCLIRRLAYWRGNQLGHKRIKTGCKNLRVGQQAVLSRY